MKSRSVHLVSLDIPFDLSAMSKQIHNADYVSTAQHRQFRNLSLYSWNPNPCGGDFSADLVLESRGWQCNSLLIGRIGC